jgi:hypothetical protein
MKLLDAVVTATTGAWFDIPQFPGKGNDAIYACYVYSTDFDGCVLTIQITPESGTPVNIFTARTIDESQATFTLADVQHLRLHGAKVRAKLTGGGTPAALSVVLF